jgi:hypothetical protein
MITALRRMARSLCTASALAGCLLQARIVAPRWGDRAAAAWLARRGIAEDYVGKTDISWDPGYPQMKENLSHFLSFAITVALCAVGLVLSEWAIVRLERARGARFFPFAALGSAAGVIVAAALKSKQLGWIAPFFLIAVACFVAGARRGESTGQRPSAPGEEAPVGQAAVVVIAATLSLAWGAWIVGVPRGWGPAVFFPVSAVGSWLGFRIGRAAARPNRHHALGLEILTMSPLLLLPALALLRAPSPWLVVAALPLGVAFRAMALLWPRALRAIPAVATVVAPVAMGALFVIPLGMRELSSANYAQHEGFHAGWMSSIFFGKWMLADANLIYGLLREYLLAGWLRIAGVNLLQLRVGHLILNLVALAMVAVISWRLSGRRLWLHLTCMYLTVFHTQLRCFVNYRTYICFGWADLMRTTLGVVAVLAALKAVFEFPTSGARRADWLRLGAAGTLTGLSLLYSQEYGLAALLTVLPLTFVDRFFRGPTDPWERWQRAVKPTAGYLVGAVTPLAITLLVYAAAGKARLLLKTTFLFGALSSSGKMSSMLMDSPVTGANLLDPWSLTRALWFGGSDARYNDAPIEFVAVVAVYFVAMAVLAVLLVRRSWTDGATILTGLVLFGLVSFRVTLAYPDYYHLFGASLPAILALVRMTAAFGNFTLPGPSRWTTPIGRTVGVAVLLMGVFIAECVSGLRTRGREIAAGTEVPPPAKSYSYPDLPRAGDMLIPDDLLELARFLRTNTAATDPIFVRQHMLEGGEVYFLAERRNPTRMDSIQEIWTPELRQEVLASLTRDPPRYVVGADTYFMGAELLKYLGDHWSPYKTFGMYNLQAPPGAP